mgnify:CR=1 FL=1
MSADEDAFLAAIRSNPADDTPRLVYADWLDERGDALGALLRAEFELARLAARVVALRRDVSVDWLNAVRPRVKVVLHRINPAERLAAISLVRLHRMGKTMDLQGATEVVEHLPWPVGRRSWGGPGWGRRAGRGPRAVVDGCRPG